MRKSIFAILVAALFSPIIQGQMVTTVPAVPTLGTVIKIFFDSSLDPNTNGLKNYTGDIYVHTGVILQGSSAWQNVIGTWGNNGTQPKCTYLGNHLYELDITPDIKTFYSVAAGATVQKIALVFRNTDGTLQTSPDIFIDVFATGLNALFTLPEKTSFIVELNKSIPVAASATLADSVTLYINNQYIRSGSTPDSVNYLINTSQYGEFWVKAVAWKKPSFAADSFFFYVRRPVVVASLPAGVNDGINYTGTTTATLVLLAPYKSYSFVLGDFNGWRPGDQGYMKMTPDGQRYWIDLSGLAPGKEYRFQYLVDSTIIAEPYCDKVLDPDNDQYITSVTYPGLIPYPKDTASGIVSVLQTNQQPYSWKNSSFQSPQKTKLVIYELLVRDFVAKHSFSTVTDSLKYLKRLGVNAIELMPVTEFEGNSSWGYNVSFYFAPDKYYGPKNTMKAFVDSCHSKGIAVIMDLVMNHCFGQSPFVQLYLDYYATDQIVMKLPNPWFNAISPNPVYHWGADFNHENPETQKLVDRVTSYWMTEYHIDGFRFDFSKGYTNTPGEGSAYDASRIAILKRIANKIWSVNSNAYVILEHFTANSEEKELAEYGMMPWGNLNNQYCEAAMGFTSDLSWGTSIARGWTVPNLVTYMESHDEERMMYKAVNFGNSGVTYNIKNLQTALKRMELSTVFFLTIPGPKMIWQFGEVGYDMSINYNGRVGEKPILWNYYNVMSRYRLFLIYKILNNLRSTQNVFSTADYTYSLTGMQKSIQLNSAGMDVDILGNFDIVPAAISPSFQHTGKWYEYFTDDSIIVAGVNDQVTLQAGEYRLYTTTRLSSPKTLLGIEPIRSGLSASFATAYPNPSASQFYFELKGVQPSELSISIFDVSGREIALITGRVASPESEIITWDGKTSGGDETGKGIYFARITAGMRSEVLRLVKN